MGNEKISFLIVPGNTSNVKQMKFSRGFLVVFACFLLTGMAAFSYVLYDYVNLKRTMPTMQSLSREVSNQRAQIQTYAQKIKALNDDMVALHEFEKKIRVIANVEVPDGKDAIFGIGGTLGDLETLPPLNENQDDLVRAMHANLEKLDEAAIVQRSMLEDLHDYLDDQRSLLASTPAIRPTTGWVSSGFGYRTSPFTDRREFHRGIDIATRKGTPVVAPADGVVTCAKKNGGLGNMVVIDHGYGKVTRYAHLDKWLVKAGQHIKRGDKIGLVGNTGRSTAPHLHYEIHVNGIPMDPVKYILN